MYTVPRDRYYPYPMIYLLAHPEMTKHAMDASLGNMYKTCWDSVNYELPTEFCAKALALKNSRFMEKVVSPAAMKISPHGGFIRVIMLGPFSQEEYGRVRKFAGNKQLDFFEEDETTLLFGITEGPMDDEFGNPLNY